jgi:hypothetical protein
MRNKLLPQSVFISSVVGRDAFGAPTLGPDLGPVPARVVVKPVQLITNQNTTSQRDGVQTVVQGISVTMDFRDEAVIGAIIKFGGVGYTIQKVALSPDVAGGYNFAIVEAAVLREDAQAA